MASTESENCDQLSSAPAENPPAPVLALQLTLGLTLGRRWCLPCVFCFEVVQPRWGEGPLEDSRPPASKIGAGSVVLEDVPPHCTVAGIPARQVGYPAHALPALEMDQSIDAAKGG